MSVLTVSPVNFGDYNCRDIFHRNQYLRSSTGQVSTKSYTLSSSTAYNIVTQHSSVQSDLSGRWKLLIKSASGTLSDSGTAVVDATALKVTFNSDVKTTGSFAIDDVVTSRSGTTLTTTFPSSQSVRSLSYNDSSGTSLASLTDTGLVTLSGDVQVGGNVLVSQDLHVTGETSLYGITTIAADATNVSKLLFTGESSAGMVVGPSLSTPTASFLYGPTSSVSSGAAFESSAPLVYRGTSSSSQLGEELSVVDSTDTTQSITISPWYIQLNQSWRISVDSNNYVVFQFLVGSSWVTKARVTK